MTKEEILQSKEKEELAVCMPNGRYFAIQTSSEGGYDYTFYDFDYTDLDGGIVDGYPDIAEAAEELISEEYGYGLADCNMEDYGDLMELVEDAEDF